MSFAFDPMALGEYPSPSAGVGAGASVSPPCKGDAGTAWRDGVTCRGAQEPAPEASPQGTSCGRDRKVSESVCNALLSCKWK